MGWDSLHPIGDFEEIVHFRFCRGIPSVRHTIWIVGKHMKGIGTMQNSETIYAVADYDGAVLDIVTMPADEVWEYARAHPVVLGWGVTWHSEEEVP